MTPDNTLKAALDLIAKPDPTATSAYLIQTRDELDIEGAKAAVELLHGRRDRLLVSAVPDKEIEACNAEIRTAELSLSRRVAVTKAIEPLIADAQAREALAATEALGVEARAARLRALQAYVDLDAAALQIVDLLDRINIDEAFISGANARFRQEGRSDLLSALPMAELSALANVAGEYLPFISKFSLHGYTVGPNAHLGDVDAQPITPARRFGRLAELLPDAKPSRKAA